jgi:hypothetical protein
MLAKCYSMCAIVPFGVSLLREYELALLTHTIYNRVITTYIAYKIKWIGWIMNNAASR